MTPAAPPVPPTVRSGPEPEVPDQAVTAAGAATPQSAARLFRDRVRELRRVPASVLRANPKNWRRHPQGQRDALGDVLRQIGYADALLAREVEGGGLELIDGHLRAEITGDQPVPVLVLDVTEQEADVLLATLDPLAAMAEADPAKLSALVEELSLDGPAARAMVEDLARQSALAAAKMIVEDTPPAVLAEPVTRPGDLWVLGPKGKPLRTHRLLCGDSTVLEVALRVMGDDRAALVATDPPYLVDYTGERPAHGGRDSGKDWSKVYREVEVVDAEKFFTGVFTAVLAVMAPHAPIYCWHAHRRCGMIQAVWERLGIHDHQQLIWVKPASVFGRVFWHLRHEPCMMGWRKKSMPEHTATDPAVDPHEHDSVWEVGWERGDTAAAAAEPGVKARPGNNEHPTQKPVEIFARPMRRHTRLEQVCYEPFSGSGTQLIAAEQLGRRCRAVEIEPRFVDVAVRRWQRFTGLAAVLEETGETWAQVAARRGVKVDDQRDVPGRTRTKKGA